MDCTIYVAKTKVLNAYAKSRFSHDVAQIIVYEYLVPVI